MDAPKRIWAWPDYTEGWMTGSWSANTYSAEPVCEYILAAEHARIVTEKDARIARLREANGILEDALQEVGDDYPGSSCQEWCQQQVMTARKALENRDE